jgi:hypothetical protein
MECGHKRIILKKNKDEIKLKKKEGGNKYFSVSIVTR